MHAGASAQLMSDIALCLNLQGNFADARDMLKETLNVLSRSPLNAATQATTAMAQSNLAVSLLAMGASPTAKVAVRSALELLSAGAGEALPVKPTLYARAAILIATGVCPVLAPAVLAGVAAYRSGANF
jgi:hypothetical protein